MLDSVVRQHQVVKLHQSGKRAIIHMFYVVLRELPAPKFGQKSPNSRFGKKNLQNSELFALFQVWDLTEFICTHIPKGRRKNYHVRKSIFVIKLTKSSVLDRESRDLTVRLGWMLFLWSKIPDYWIGSDSGRWSNF